jgi:Kinesin motor domain
MGSGSSDMRLGGDSFGIIPRVIKSLFDIILQKEEEDANSSYKVHIQFLELYGEDIKDLLENTKTSPITIRETATGDVFVSGAREETVTSASQMLRALEDGSRHRTTASTMMNSSSSRSHGKNHC